MPNSYILPKFNFDADTQNKEDCNIVTTMTPWPTADVQSSYNYNISPAMSPMQQGSQDPFAAYGAGPAPPQQQQQQQPPNQQPQPPPAQMMHQQPVGNADPWAAMVAAPTQQPPSAPVAAPQPQELTPPPAVVSVDSSNQVPPSPMGDVSVLAATTNVNAAPAQRLQPAPQPMQPHLQAPTTVPVVAANPFDFDAVASAMPAAPPPAGMPPQAPPTPPRADAAAVQGAPQPQQPQQMISPPLSPQSAGFAPQQGFADAFGYGFTPMASPVTSPVVSPRNSPGAGNGTMVPSAALTADPFGVNAQQPGVVAAVPPTCPPPFMPGTQAPAPMAQAQATEAVVPSATPSADPFGVFGAQQQPPAAVPALAPNADPFGSSALVAPGAPPAGGAASDPFGLFGAPTPAPAAAAPTPTQAPASAQDLAQAPAFSQEEDPWAAAGFNNMVSKPEPSQPEQHANGVAKEDETPITLDSNNLPSEGEYYEARINARSLGAMFYTARNLEETLFHKMPANVIDALGSRPVVAYVAEKSAAHNSGVHLGHVILTVNGHEISDPEFCANMIRSVARPMVIRCYVPPRMELTLNEGTHLVKYDTKDMEAPKVGVEWKRKYVVVGGIVTKPWMMNMFYRKVSFKLCLMNWLDRFCSVFGLLVEID